MPHVQGISDQLLQSLVPSGVESFRAGQAGRQRNIQQRQQTELGQQNIDLNQFQLAQGELTTKAQEANSLLGIEAPEQLRSTLIRRAQEITRNPVPGLEAADFIDMANRLGEPNGFNAIQNELRSDIARIQKIGAQLKQTAGEREFASMTAGFSPEEVERARRISAGLSPRAVGSAVQTITEGGTAEDIAKTEQTLAEARKFGALTGSSRAKAIDSGFQKIASIDKNLRNIDRAVEQLDAGASTGAIESRFFPSIRAATVALEQIQSELALDVVGATTFGALSAGELNLAKEVALPTKLEPEELKQFLTDKRVAQEKLRAYFKEQIDHLDQGGTLASFLRQKERTTTVQQEVAPQAAPRVAPQPQAARTRQRGARARPQAESGRVMVDAQGNRARVFEDGTFEEL